MTPQDNVLELKWSVLKVSTAKTEQQSLYDTYRYYLRWSVLKVSTAQGISLNGTCPQIYYIIATPRSLSPSCYYVGIQFYSLDRYVLILPVRTYLRRKKTMGLSGLQREVLSLTR